MFPPSKLSDDAIDKILNRYNGAKVYQETEGSTMVDLKMVISDDARKRIQYWVDIAPGEVSGLGKVQYFKDANALLVENVWLVKQRNTGSSTELDAAEVGRLMYQTKDLPGELKFWWHSHADFGVFWSGTDTDTFKNLGGNGWLCGTVFNKKKEMLSALYVAEPFRLWVPRITTTIYTPVPEEWKNEYDKATKESEDAKAALLAAAAASVTPPPLPGKRARRRARKKARELSATLGYNHLDSLEKEERERELVEAELEDAFDGNRTYLRGWGE